jgi:Uma2 family endonuclease
MASHAPQRMTLAAFLEWDDGTERRYQLRDGIPIMMAPRAEIHGELAAAFMVEIGGRLKRSCRVVADARITVEGRGDTCYVADLAVTRAPREQNRRTVAEPVLVVEVMSRSAGQVDRSRKVAAYRTRSSVQEIVIAFHDERRIILQRREPEGWWIENLISKRRSRSGPATGRSRSRRSTAIFCPARPSRRRPQARDAAGRSGSASPSGCSRPP